MQWRIRKWDTRQNTQKFYPLYIKREHDFSTITQHEHAIVLRWFSNKMNIFTVDVKETVSRDYWRQVFFIIIFPGTLITVYSNAVDYFQLLIQLWYIVDYQSWCWPKITTGVLKGLSYEIDFKNVDENWQILALIRAAAGSWIFRRYLWFLVEIKHVLSGKC